MITLRNVTLRRGSRVLLKQLNWTIYAGARVGVIGANGSGKSTLFGLLLKELQPEEGDLEFGNKIILAHVAQEIPDQHQSALKFVLSGDLELTQLQHELELADAAHDGMRISLLHEKLSQIDAYSAPARAAQLLAGLGFSDEEQQKKVADFSGGFRVRLALARALMCRSDILLLDEPTNHLDLDAILWLEQWLRKYPGTLLLISHDRDFLDQTVSQIAHIENERLQLYTGDYSQFEKQRAANLLLQQAAYEKQQHQLAHLQQFVDRFRAKASKAKQAQSRLKAIERMDIICAVQQSSPFQFSFKSPTHCPNPLLTIDKATLGYGDKIILQNVNLVLAPKDRIALLGPNGAGKSTFIKFLAGEINALHGVYEKNPGLKIGYFAQHQVDHLDLSASALLQLNRLAPHAKEQELRTFLGSFGFNGERVFESIENFSGGEKSRLALALIVWQKPNLLLLDEPTNHLDLEMREALSIALQGYEGAMILVSHDRFLVRTTVDQLLLVAHGGLNDFNGDLQEYEQWLLQFRKDQAMPDAASKEESSKKMRRQQEAKRRDNLRPFLTKIKQLEEKLNKLQKEMTTVQHALADLSLYEPQNKQQLQTHLSKQVQLKQEISLTEEQWLMASDEFEQQNRQLDE